MTDQPHTDQPHTDQPQDDQPQTDQHLRDAHEAVERAKEASSEIASERAQAVAQYAIAVELSQIREALETISKALAGRERRDQGSTTGQPGG